jgi:hypothetical protein
MLTYELGHLGSGNLIDWFADRDDALDAVYAFLEADEADIVALFIRDEEGTIVSSATGAALVEWASLPSSDC